MNTTNNANSPLESDAILVNLMSREQGINNLESLFTPLQPNEPVEQFVRRT